MERARNIIFDFGKSPLIHVLCVFLVGWAALELIVPDEILSESLFGLRLAVSFGAFVIFTPSAIRSMRLTRPDNRHYFTFAVWIGWLSMTIHSALAIWVRSHQGGIPGFTSSAFWTFWIWLSCLQGVLSIAAPRPVRRVMPPRNKFALVLFVGLGAILTLVLFLMYRKGILL